MVVVWRMSSWNKFETINTSRWGANQGTTLYHLESSNLTGLISNLIVSDPPGKNGHNITLT